MDSLKSISSDTIRENWLEYRDTVQNSPYYDLLWENLESKFNLDKNDVYLSILKKFINNQEIDCKKPLFNQIYITQINNDTLEFKGLDNDERKQIHLLCNKIGLHHESKSHPKKNHKRFLYIYKPKLWLWEYTEKNPFSKSEEYYEKVQLEKKIKQQKFNEKMSRRYCCICDRTGLETELLCSVYIRGLYCNDCIENTSDDEGGRLSGHKFEPM